MNIDDIVSGLNRARAQPLYVEQRMDPGMYGAWILRDASDRRVVLKVDKDPASNRLLGVAERVERLRTKGYPAPAHFPVVEINGVTVWLQEFVEGTASDHIDQQLLEFVVATNVLQHGEGDPVDASWHIHIVESLTDGVSHYCTHERLTNHSTESRRLLGRIKEIGRSISNTALGGGDLVHHDLHHRNILHDNGVAAVVVDWDGCRTGDALFDLVTFWTFLHGGISDATADHLEWMTDQLEATARFDAIAAYVGHMSIRAVNHCSRTYGDAVAAEWIDQCHAWLDRWA